MASTGDAQRRSKDIRDYFPVELSKFYPVESLPFDLNIYFPHNNHLIIVKGKGSALTLDYIQRKSQRGLKEVWIHKEDQDAFIQYSLDAIEVNQEEFGNLGLIEDPFEEHNSLRGEMEEVLESQPTTQEGAIMAGVLNAPELEKKDKEIILEEAAKELLAQMGESDEVTDQEAVDRYARRVVGDILASTSGLGGSTANEIWRLTNIEPRLVHSVNVSTYSVLFAIAAGKYDIHLISDVATAGLMHDVGLCQVSASVTSLPWGELKTSQLKEYSRHVQEGVRLLGRYSVELPQRVIQMISQHHERMDGSGYPNSLGGSAISLEAQLIALADTLVSISSGRWDGKNKTLRDSMEVLLQLLEEGERQEAFDKELALKVIGWMKSQNDQSVFEEAAQSVLEQADDLMKTGS